LSSSFSACARSFASAARSPCNAHQNVCRGVRLEPRRAVDRARDLEHGLAPPRRLRVEQAVDTIEPPARDARERRRLILREARRAPGDLLPDGLLRQPPERDGLAARADRRGQRAEIVGDEHGDRIRRRLLEVLEQRVGGFVVQRMRSEDEIDAAVGLEGTHVQVVPELADRVDPDLVAERLEHVEVRVRSALDPAWVAEQRAREADRGAALPHSGRAVEEVRVRWALREGGIEQAPGLGLLRKALEACHAPPSRFPRATSSRRG